MKIGNVQIKGKFALAPMAAVNCTAFRMLCKENGAGLIYTQRYDTERINEKHLEKIKKFLNIQDSERPITVQIIGSNAEDLVEAAKKVEPFADIIDINVGCGEEEFLRTGSGAALLTDLEKLEHIIKQVVQSVKKPVTAKIRIGVDGQSINGINIALTLEKAGVKAIAVHGRTIQQKYGGKSNWTIMKQIKEKLSIPIIANGDIEDYQDGIELLEKTGCDMVMIGREAKHRPWVFNKDKQKLSNDEIKREIHRFIDLYEQHENRISPHEVGDHVYWMLRDFKTKENTKLFQKMRSIDEIKANLIDIS